MIACCKFSRTSSRTRSSSRCRVRRRCKTVMRARAADSTRDRTLKGGPRHATVRIVIAAADRAAPSWCWSDDGEEHLALAELRRHVAEPGRMIAHEDVRI